MDDPPDDYTLPRPLVSEHRIAYRNALNTDSARHLNEEGQRWFVFSDGYGYGIYSPAYAKEPSKEAFSPYHYACPTTLRPVLARGRRRQFRAYLVAEDLINVFGRES